MEKMEKKEKISFVTNATTREAAVYVMLFVWVIIRNAWRAVNKAVHRLPWVFLLIMAALFLLGSLAKIGQARAERDRCSKRLADVTRQLDSYKAMCGEGKEVAR